MTNTSDSKLVSNLTFVLFSNCIPVKGAKRSIIVDLQREVMYYITNELYEIIQDLKTLDYSSYIDEYDDESVQVVKKYLSYLEEHELGFWTDEPSNFPELPLDYVNPSIITNAIIDNYKNSCHNWKSIFIQLEELGCQDIQIRFFDAVPLEEIISFMELLDVSSIKSVDLIVRYDKGYHKRALKKLTERFFRIKTITLHGAPMDEIYLLHKDGIRSSMGNIIFVKQLIDSNLHCGQISPLYFSFSGLKTVTESYNFNSCLNRKVSIDYNGDIKNCPTLPEVYGNVNTHRISEVINEDFMKYWNITKDQINICKVCEYRYVCTDCRAFLDNKFDKPKKCKYDPYTLEWNN